MPVCNEEELREVAQLLLDQIDTNKNSPLEKEQVKAFSKRIMEKMQSEFDEKRFEENFAAFDKLHRVIRSQRQRGKYVVSINKSKLLLSTSDLCGCISLEIGSTYHRGSSLMGP